MNVQISKQFNLLELLRFSIPTIMLLILSSFYTTVDGIFISRFVGSDALSSLNIVLPLIYFMYGLAIMLGSGASAIIGKKLGEGKTREAKENFTLITVVALAVGITLSLIIRIGISPIATALGASDLLMPFCKEYRKILYSFITFHIIQFMYYSLFVTAGKARLALAVSIISGLINICLDYVFIVILDMGISGAAWGTGLSQAFGGIFPLIYFVVNRKGMCYVRPKMDGKMIIHAMANGSSEMVGNLASAITTFLFNISMMKLIGEDGIAAISIMLYLQFTFSAIFFGFSTIVAPIISYNYGKKDTVYLKKLFRYCLYIVGGSTVLVLVVAWGMAKPLIGVFSEIGSRVYQITFHGYMIFIWNFIFAGYNIFSSALFSAFSNGLISAIISFMRTLVFIVVSVLVLPNFLGIDGLWLAIPVSELLTTFIAVPCLIKYGKNTYHYL